MPFGECGTTGCEAGSVCEKYNSGSYVDPETGEIFDIWLARCV